MGDNFYLGDRDGVRTPMQWSPDRNAGFSDANPQQLYLPIILDPEYHYESVNVETQRANTSSLFWFMKRIINMRKKYKAFSRGDQKFINVDNPNILAFTRTYEEQTMLVIVNLSRYSQPAQLYFEDFKGSVPIEVFSKNKFPAISNDGPYFYTAGPYSYDWFLLRPSHHKEQEPGLMPEIKMGKWKDLATTKVKDALAAQILPSYFSKSFWFSGKERNVHSLSISEMTMVQTDEDEIYFTLVDVNYESGLPETYLLPLAMMRGTKAKKVMGKNPESIISKVIVDGKEGFLCDALYLHDLQKYMFNNIARNQSVTEKNGQLIYEGNKDLKKYIKDHKSLNPRIVSTDNNYSTVAFNNDYLLKMYRLVEKTTNPDLELTRYLSEQVKMKDVPKFVGQVSWRIGKSVVDLGMLQELVETHGTGRAYMLERLNGYMERIFAMEKNKLPKPISKGSWVEPVASEGLPEAIRNIIGVAVSEAAIKIGILTGEMHKAFAASNEKDYAAEDFSLHYQRSLFSGLQALVRRAFTNQETNLGKLPKDVKKEVGTELGKKEKVLSTLKRVYANKIDVDKIRIHGNFNLGQIFYTGKEFNISNFGGDATRSFSERRLKRSPLRDVAGIIRSIHYVAYEGMLLQYNGSAEEKRRLEAFAEMWAHQVSGFFMHAYLQATKDCPFIPKDKNELQILLDTFVLEKSIFSLSYELKHRPDWVLVPTRLMKTILARS